MKTRKKTTSHKHRPDDRDAREAERLLWDMCQMASGAGRAGRGALAGGPRSAASPVRAAMAPTGPSASAGAIDGLCTTAAAGGATRPEPVEEHVRHLLAGGVDQAGAELGDLAADLGIDDVGQQGARAVIGRLHIGAALGEAGDAALALAGDTVGVGRIEVGQLNLAVEAGGMGPILTAAVARNSLSAVFSRLSQPGMQAFSTAGSFNASHTFWRGAGIRRSPFMSIGSPLHPVRHV